MKTILCIVAVLCILCNADPYVVETLQGKLGGFPIDDKTRAYHNIPYAQPPINERRFRKPEPLPDSPQWEGIRDAANYGPVCGQDSSLSTLLPMSEDCLQLNIWTPLDAHKLPVMFFVHGGSFTSGSGIYYPGRQLSHQNVVVVSINYRLGAFGFIGGYDLQKEHESTGNYGIYDQIEALRWVKKNIANFGGDPNRVTVFGESAGAISLSIHLVSPAVSEDLFERIIIQSAGSLYKTQNCTVPNAEINFHKLRKSLQCDDLNCMRQKSLQDVVWHSRGIDFLPLVDGVVLTQGIFSSLKKGEFKKKSLIVGTTSNEMSLWLCPKYGDVISEEKLQEIVLTTYGDVLAREIFKLYKRVDFEEPIDMLNAIATDAVMHCPSRYFGKLVSDSVPQTYQYTFDYAIPQLNSKCRKATHASELPLQFPDQLTFYNYTLTSSESDLSTNMLKSWASFAKTGNPNSGYLQWLRYNGTTDFETKISVPSYAGARSKYYELVCSLWDNFISD